MLHDHPYTPYFCEENIWHLASRMMAEGVGADCLSVLVLSNDRRRIPLFAQRAGPRQDGFVLWDYHVILHQTGDGGRIFDFDTRLPFPCSFDQYRSYSFPDAVRLPEEFRIQVRVVPAADWVRYFASDRSHMRDADGKPLQPFPSWVPIGPLEGEPSIDLTEYLDMRLVLPDRSRVYALEELSHRLADVV